MNWTKYGEAQKAAAHQKVLDDLARMRSSLKDMTERDRKAAQREPSGRFHSDVTGHEWLAAHLVGPDHGMALLPSWRGSTKSMALAHEVAHSQRRTGHAIGDVSNLAAREADVKRVDHSNLKGAELASHLVTDHQVAPVVVAALTGQSLTLLHDTMHAQSSR
jgi:hypothetical protein